MPRRKRLKPSHLRPFLGRCLSLLLLFALLSLSFPFASLQDQPSEPTYDELIALFGEEDLSSMTVDDAAWDALLGVMGKWTDFLIYHAYDPTQHPWLNRLQTLGKLLSLRTLSETGLLFCEGEEEEKAWEQVSETLNMTAWDTLEQLILIGMAATGKVRLSFPAGNGYFVEVVRQVNDSGQDSNTGSEHGTPSVPTLKPEPRGGEFFNSQPNKLYIARWLVRDSDGNTNIVEEATRLVDIALWIDPQAPTSWNWFIPRN